jgi:DNA-binding LacI/PurR family transcriptional regulator
MQHKKIRNMEEFAAVSGISRPTVAKYFHDAESVRASTREKIEAALVRHDYRPNLFAMNQNKRLTKNIGIVVPNLTDPFFAELVRHIEQICLEGGYWPFVLSSHGNAEQEINALETLRSLKLAGAVIAPLGRASRREALEQFAEDVPTVNLDGELGIGQAFVGTNNFQSIGLIVDYLCRVGTPPCFLEMPSLNANADERRTAYIQAMERLGHTPQPIAVRREDWSFEEVGYQEGLRIFSSYGLPSSTILCANDRIAIGLLAAAYERGLRVGHGAGSAIRIAGHDDHPMARFTCPPLTTVSQDYETMAARAATILFSLIDGSAPDKERSTLRLEGKLIMRASA